MYVKAGESTVCQHHKAEEPQICMQTIAKVKHASYLLALVCCLSVQACKHLAMSIA